MFLVSRHLPFVVVAAVAVLLGTAVQARELDAPAPEIGQTPSAFLMSSGVPTFAADDPFALDLVDGLAIRPDGAFHADLLAYAGRGEMSPLPSPTTWAMLLAGFGLTGAALRRGQLYRLVEQAANGAIQTEEFHAPDDQSAIERALSVAEGVRLELWRGDQLVQRIDAPVQAAS
jgi:hypothetical protein